MLIASDGAGCSSANTSQGDTPPDSLGLSAQATVTSVSLATATGGTLTVTQPQPGQQVLIATPFLVTGRASGVGMPEPHTVDSVTVQVDNLAPQEANLARVAGSVPTVAFSAAIQIGGPPGPHRISVVATLDIGSKRKQTVSVSAGCPAQDVYCQGACVAQGGSNACSRTVFVTSGTYPSNLGGLAGADQNCQALAGAASLPGTYQAWLSDSQAAANTRLNHAPDSYYRLTNDTVVATSWSGLLSGSLLSPIVCDEHRQCGQFAQNPWVWTSTGADGSWTGSSCSDWTSTTQTMGVFVGDCAQRNDSWSAVIDPALCGPGGLHLYCIQTQ